MVRNPAGGRGGRDQSGPLDALTDTDNLLRERVIPAQNDMAQSLSAVAQALQSMNGGTGGSDAEEILANEQYPVDLSLYVPANTERQDAETVEYEAEFDAEIRTVIVGFPDATQNAVPMQFGTAGGQRFIPFNKEDQYIAFEDFVYAFGLRTFVEKGTVLVAEYFNLTADAKFVNCVVELREV